MQIDGDECATPSAFFFPLWMKNRQVRCFYKNQHLLYHTHKLDCRYKKGDILDHLTSVLLAPLHGN